MRGGELEEGMEVELAGGEYEQEGWRGARVEGDADDVTVKESYFDHEQDDTRHCARYEKTAEFESVTGVWWRWVGGGNKYFYKCK